MYVFFCLIKLKSKRKKKEIIKDGGEKNETLRVGNLLEMGWDRSITPKGLDRGMKRSIFSFFLNLALKPQPRGHVRHESLSICMNYLTWIRPHKRGTLQELGWMSNAPIMAVDGTLHLAHRSKFTRRPHSIPIVHLRPTCIYWIDKQRLNVLFITRYTWNIPRFILSSLFKRELISIVGCYDVLYL